MDPRTYIIGYFIVIVFLSIISPIIYFLKPVVYEEELKPIYHDVVIVFNPATNDILVVDHRVYEIRPRDQLIYKLRARISYIVRNASLIMTFAKNAVIEADHIRSRPIEIPFKVSYLADYYEYVESKYSYTLLGEGVKNRSMFFYRIDKGYLVLDVKYSIDPNALFDATQYVSPITYYPYQPPPRDLLMNLVKESFNNYLYSVVLTQAFYNILKDNTDVKVFLQYRLSSKCVHVDRLFYGWLILVLLVEIYEPRALLIFAKTLFYKSRALPHYLRRVAQTLWRYIHELGRI